MANDTSERILEACERVISRSGLRGFRMTDVAREAGVSIGLLSYHFGDRDGLLQAALDHVNASAARRAAAEEGAVGGSAGSAAGGAEYAGRAAHSPAQRAPGERLAALLCSEFGDDPQVRAGSTAWNELRAAAVFEPDRAAALARSTADWAGEVQRLTALAAPQADAAAAALILTALVEGLSGRWLTGQITAREAQTAVRAALGGLGLLDERPRPGSECSAAP